MSIDYRGSTTLDYKINFTLYLQTHFRGVVDLVESGFGGMSLRQFLSSVHMALLSKAPAGCRAKLLPPKHTQMVV